jgi:hypothetical protein
MQVAVQYLYPGQQVQGLDLMKLIQVQGKGCSVPETAACWAGAEEDPVRLVQVPGYLYPAGQVQKVDPMRLVQVPGGRAGAEGRKHEAIVEVPEGSPCNPLGRCRGRTP